VVESEGKSGFGALLWLAFWNSARCPSLYAATPPAGGDAALSKAAFPCMLDAEPQAVRRTSDDGEPHVLKFLVSAAIFLFLSGCQMTRDREADSQKEFDSAVQAQHKTIARLCEKIDSEVQRRRCLGE
jgi:hypothetical protein